MIQYPCMMKLLTVTSKGQITLSQKLMKELGITVGDKLAVTVTKNHAILEPAGRGILDIAGTGGTFKIPKGKTLDDLINEAHEEGIGRDLRGL